MRITRDTLLKIATDAAMRQARNSPDMLAAYLCGSLLEEEFLLGGATDIDLVFIYAAQAPGGREIVRLTDEVHLDILHHEQRVYRDTRKLRVHPWMGPTLNGCKVLYDPQHFMDFTQASVRGQYDRPDHIFERSRQEAEEARRIWMGFRLEETDAGPAEVDAYLQALEHAANSLAVLVGPPLTERRFLPGFQRRMERLGKPGLYIGMLGLLGVPNLGADGLKGMEDWLPDWRTTYDAAAETRTLAHLHTDRLFYYSLALQSMLGNDTHEAALWPLMRTWTMAAKICQAEGGARASKMQGWRKVFNSLGLAGLPFTGRIEALDAYLDSVDETLEGWARTNGAWQE